MYVSVYYPNYACSYLTRFPLMEDESTADLTPFSTADLPHFWNFSYFPMFQKTVIAFMIEDDVIQKFDS
jgi:hypothetical protein